MIILCHRSSFLRQTLISSKKNNDSILYHIKLSNVSPETFQIILRYLYGGIFSLNERDTLDIFNVLIAADEDDLQMKEIEVWNYVLKWGLAQIKGTGEILGGHSPSLWKSTGGWSHSYYSFIFSFKSKDDIKDSILSRIKNTDKAFYYHDFCGPSFGGSDLSLSVCKFNFRANPSKEFDDNICRQFNYEKMIRDTDEHFCIEDYEVFRIKKKVS
ncbi:BTB/POZ protein [Rhizophagus irregularis DAOM 181602=DAOM 197198]|nr:BTB/POZ protein [Rhizophagus irregularis DAOM 181602=DAOM 197198]